MMEPLVDHQANNGANLEVQWHLRDLHHSICRRAEGSVSCIVECGRLLGVFGRETLPFVCAAWVV